MLYFAIEGFYNTHNLRKYILRLTRFGVLATPAEIYLTEEPRGSFLTTLALCLITCLVHEKIKNTYIKLLLYLGLLVLAHIRFEGGYKYIIFTLLIIYYTKEK